MEHGSWNRYLVRAVFTTAFSLSLATLADARTITLAWDPNPEPDIAGYTVYRGATCSAFTQSFAAGPATTYTVTNLPDGESHCFAVQAYNTAGQVSPLSDPITVPALSGSNPVEWVDSPGALSDIKQPFVMGGWAIDTGSTNGPGVDMIHVYAYPNPGSSQPPIFLGVATYGMSRPDIAAAFGHTRYTNSGFEITINGLSTGRYQLVGFVHSTVAGAFNSVATVTVNVQPGPLAAIDAPAAGLVSQPFSIDGWSIDPSASAGTGVDQVSIFAYPQGGGSALPLGVAVYGLPRPDVAAVFGPRFLNSRYQLVIDTLPPGIYDLEVRARSTGNGQTVPSARVRVTVRGRPWMAIDGPANLSVISGPFTVSGWALDRESASGPGVDSVHVYAFPVGTGGPAFLGVATYGTSRPDVALAFGDAKFTNSGYELRVSGNALAAGTYDIVVFARSTVTGTFNNARVTRITIP
jgi:fibronectin type III domain protein